MNPITVVATTLPGPGRLGRLGLAMRRHRGAILVLQWLVVGAYLFLVTVPALLPLPPEQARLADNLTRFAQFVFWGIWWPFVILSVVLLGRVWCGVFCPEGALTEWASQRGLGLGIPAWMKWSGWPFVAFVSTTVYGQMTSVYEYPKPSLLILGGSTVAAVAVGLVYGRGKRVWCRHLCPVSGVFGLLAKIAPLHYRVDRAAWDAAPPGERTSRRHAVNCAPLIHIRNMQSASACHMCGRCAGERNAVSLEWRSPAQEILAPDAGKRETWSARLVVFGMLGVALGAFQWSASPWFVALKLEAAEWLVARDILWPLNTAGHWWMFTDYPAVNDTFTWLDGGMLLSYIALEALLVGGWLQLGLQAAGRLAEVPWERLAMALVPFAAASVFVGLSLLTSSQLAGEGITLKGLPAARMALLLLAAAASLWLVVRLCALPSRLRRVGALLPVAAGLTVPVAAWWLQFYRW